MLLFYLNSTYKSLPAITLKYGNKKRRNLIDLTVLLPIHRFYTYSGANEANANRATKAKFDAMLDTFS